MAKDTWLPVKRGALYLHKMDNKFEVREEFIKANTAGGHVQAYLM